MSKRHYHLEVKGGLEMPVTRGQSRHLIKEMAVEYDEADRPQKSKMISNIVDLTGFTRFAVARALRLAKVPKGCRRKVSRKKRECTYGPDVAVALCKIWAVLDYPSGKRLAPFMSEILASLERFEEIQLTESTKQKLLEISASTIDRILAPIKKAARIKGRSGTKPGSMLKSQIPVRTFQQWDDARPGFLEIDLVEHNGGSCKGDFICTLDAVDVATRWTETQAVRNKAQKWVFEALMEVFSRMPFNVSGIDSDNGSEFINCHLVRFCQENKITFTRSRPNKKNDSCFVEQKNWSVVRRALGYGRFESIWQLELINRLYLILRLFTNYFQPVMTLLSKQRTGAKLSRQYNVAQTPYQRIMSSELVPEDIKARLTAEYLSLNPAKLRRQILSLQDTLNDSLVLKSSFDESLVDIQAEGPLLVAAGPVLKPDFPDAGYPST